MRFDYRRDICPRRSSEGSLSAYVDGFSLHAGVNIRSHRRDENTPKMSIDLPLKTGLRDCWKRLKDK